MNKKAERILRKYKNKRVGVFIDDANMFHTQREVGWFIDWRKLKVFLEENFKVKFIKYYRGIYPRNEKIPQKIKENHWRYGQILRKIGLEVIHRDLKKIYLDKKKAKFIFKCDFDAEIGFDVAINFKAIDLIMGKNFLMICFDYKAPWEVRKIHHIFLEDIKEKVILRKEKPGF